MQNYFEYFSEIEERFSRRRGSLLLLSTLDWALIETWREAGVPLEAVLRGIDSAFDKHEQRTARARGRIAKVNGLAWCAQAVMQAAQEMVDAATGSPVQQGNKQAVESGFEKDRVTSFLARNAEAVTAAAKSAGAPASGEARKALESTAERLRALAHSMQSDTAMPLDELDRALTVLEERMVSTLRVSLTDDEAIALREQAARELAPYRAKMNASQLKQVQAQFEQKRLLEQWKLPRLSLFYMGHE